MDATEVKVLLLQFHEEQVHGKKLNICFPSTLLSHLW